jgi:capsid portal protein
MMGIIPNNTGGFDEVAKVSRIFLRNELILLQKRLKELNHLLGGIQFNPYT